MLGTPRGLLYFSLYFHFFKKGSIYVVFFTHPQLSSALGHAGMAISRVPDPSYPHLAIVVPPKGESRWEKWKK